MKKKRTARIREVVVGDDKMLGVVGTNEGKKQIENQKKHTACMWEVMVGDGKILGVVGTINEGKQ